MSLWMLAWLLTWLEPLMMDFHLGYLNQQEQESLLRRARQGQQCKKLGLW
jgi:hypothetical protein